MTWRCVVQWSALPGGEPEACEATGETDRGAERHTKETGHPTVSGPNAAQRSSA